MTVFWSTLVVILGGGLGAGLRFGVAQACQNRFGESFPLGTLVINVSGSFLIGLLAGLLHDGDRPVVDGYLREFLLIGVLGGYTTFSSFSLQTFELVQRDQWAAAGANIVLSVVLCLVAVWLGHLLARGLSR